jgi:hypothetical protein
MSDSPKRDWCCSAYGPEVPVACFFEAQSACASLDECHRRMKAERQRVFHRINELAAGGDPFWANLEQEFPSPSGLLNADESDEAD